MDWKDVPLDQRANQPDYRPGWDSNKLSHFPNLGCLGASRVYFAQVGLRYVMCCAQPMNGLPYCGVHRPGVGGMTTRALNAIVWHLRRAEGKHRDPLWHRPSDEFTLQRGQELIKAGVHIRNLGKGGEEWVMAQQVTPPAYTWLGDEWLARSAGKV